MLVVDSASAANNNIELFKTIIHMQRIQFMNKLCLPLLHFINIYLTTVLFINVVAGDCMKGCRSLCVYVNRL